MAETIQYTVPGMSCSHCEHAVSSELGRVPGVEAVSVDLETKLVVVTGEGLDDAALRAAIDEAGYEASAVGSTEAPGAEAAAWTPPERV